MSLKRKYDSDNIKFGSTSIEENKEIRPQSVISAVVLSNKALKLAKLERYLKTYHANISDQPTEKLENSKKMKTGAAYRSSEKVLSV